MDKIFVAFPAMDDPEMLATAINAFRSAKYPERIYLGIAVQSVKKSLFRRVNRKFKEFIDEPNLGNIRTSFTRITSRNFFDKAGVGRGRQLAWDLYQGEEYALQVDAHTWFGQDWDEHLIELHTQAKEFTGLDKVVLTAYAGMYSYVDAGKREPLDNEKGVFRYPYFVHDSRFSQFVPNWLDESISDAGKYRFLPCVKFNANFSFGDKQFAENNGLLKHGIFWEEEVAQSVNLFDSGFALVFPVVSFPIICHLYGANANSWGGKRTGYEEYVSPRVQNLLGKISRLNWRYFIEDPKNRAAIKRYEHWAKVSLRYGVLKENYIPSTFGQPKP